MPLPLSSNGRGKRRNARKGEGGFTLVELMVVVTIIALASVTVALALPDPRGRLGDEGAAFAARVRAAHDSAIVTARPVSVWVAPGGYGFDQWQGGAWRALSDKPLRVSQWKAGTRVEIGDRVRVTFDPTGMADRALVVPMRRDGARTTVSIGVDGGVRVDG